jgi:hypothetical protein
MIKQLMTGSLLIAGFSLPIFAAPSLTQGQINTLATQCKGILLAYKNLDNMTPQEKTVATPILTQCYENNVCQNSDLMNVNDCAKRLALWYAAKSAPVIPQIVIPSQTVTPVAAPPAHPFNFNPTRPGTTPPVAPVQGPSSLAIPSTPATEPAQTPPPSTPTPPNQPTKSNINWF